MDSNPAPIPAWVTSQRAARDLCRDCGERPAATFWQSLAGPRICWECCTRRQEAARA